MLDFSRVAYQEECNSSNDYYPSCYQNEATQDRRKIDIADIMIA